MGSWVTSILFRKIEKRLLFSQQNMASANVTTSVIPYLKIVMKAVTMFVSFEMLAPQATVV